MDPRRLLTVMAQRLYEDIRFVTEQNPTQIVDDDGARAYNALIGKARKMYGNVDHVADFPDWSPRTIKYKDALVVAGQLAAMLEALAGNEARLSATIAAASSLPAGAADTGSGGRPPMVPPTLHTPAPSPSAGAPRMHVPQPPPPPAPIDDELYGAVRPPKRNDDGTIPFSLD